MLLFVIPNLELFRLSFLLMDDDGNMVFSMINYAAFFEDSVYWLTFARTVGYSLVVTILVLIVALPVSLYYKNSQYQSIGFVNGSDSGSILGE